MIVCQWRSSLVLLIFDVEKKAYMKNSGIEEMQVFDKADLMDRLDNDNDLAVELAELFILDVKKKLTRLRAAVEGKMGSQIEKEAHALKGSASNLSGEKVRYLAGVIESAGRNGDMGIVIENNKLLAHAVDELTLALKLQIIESSR